MDLSQNLSSSVIQEQSFGSSGREKTGTLTAEQYAPRSKVANFCKGPNGSILGLAGYK